MLIDFHRIEGVSSEWTLGHVRAGQEVRGSQKADTILDHFQHAAAQFGALLLGLDAQQLQHQVLLLEAAETGHFGIACHVPEVGQCHIFQFGNVDISHDRPVLCRID